MAKGTKHDDYDWLCVCIVRRKKSQKIKFNRNTGGWKITFNEPSEFTNNEGANISKAFLLSHCFAVKARELKPAPIILSPKVSGNTHVWINDTAKLWVLQCTAQVLFLPLNSRTIHTWINRAINNVWIVNYTGRVIKIKESAVKLGYESYIV